MRNIAWREAHSFTWRICVWFAVQSVIPLPPPAFHTLVQSVYILATLDPSCLYALVLKHPVAFERLLTSISPELSVAELGARFRLLDLMLIEGAAHPELPALKLAISFEHVQRELMECVANASTSIFALAVSNMVSKQRSSEAAEGASGLRHEQVVDQCGDRLQPSSRSHLIAYALNMLLLATARHFGLKALHASPPVGETS